MLETLFSLKNQFNFALRRKLKFSRKNYREPACLKITDLDQPTQARLDELKTKYDANFEAQHDLAHALENYFYLDLLDYARHTWNLEPLRHQHLVDVGAKNFCYLSCLKLFFQPDFATGIELDAYRLYQNFYTRHSYAQYFCKQAGKSEFLVMDFLEYRESASLFTLFYPYVTERPLLKGGLSLKHYQAGKLFQHLRSLLNTENQIWMINQGQGESDVAKKLAETAGLRQIRPELIYTSVFWEKPAAAVISLWTS